jgi:simple sugar transport system ATP-binding protein
MSAFVKQFLDTSIPAQVLLLDEPFQGVDVGARRHLIAAIRSKRQDSATLVATSDVEEALEIADIVAVMRNHSIAGLYNLSVGDSSSLLAAIGAVESRNKGRVLTLDIEVSRNCPESFS